jgi:uncharacterized protein YndB with AHSA1/START domain
MSYDGILRDPHTVEFKRLIPGPIELAWAFLTQREKLKTWFADVTIEPRVGGAVDIHFNPDTCGACSAGVRGVVREFRPPHAVAFSWIQLKARPDGSLQERDEGEVRFELAARGDKVLLTLLHSRLSTDELIGHSAGWHAYLQNLDSVLSQRGRIDFMAVARGVRPGYEEQLAGLQRAGAA